MYKCVECGHIFEEDDVAEWYEDRGECWGTPCSDLMAGCPKCRGYYEEAQMCDGCCEWFYEDELEDGLCESCREETEDAE